MARTPKDLIAEAKENIEEVDAAEAGKRLQGGAIAVDVREGEELANGRLPGAVHVPRGMLEFTIGKKPGMENPDAELIIYCAGGSRSALAAQTLHQLGYTGAVSLAGGFKGWVEAGQPVELDEAADDESE